MNRQAEARPPDRRDRATTLANEGWAILTTPSTLVGLLVFSAGALGLCFWVAAGEGETWRALSGADNPILGRIDALLGLHAPWEAWWMVAIPVLAVVSLTAFLIERSPWWSLRPRGRSDLARREASQISARRVRAAAACLGGRVKVAEGREQLALLATSSLHRVALGVFLVGAILLSGGIVLASQGAILGEVVLFRIS